MMFEVLSRVDPGNYALDDGADAPMGRGTFRGVYSHCNAYDFGAWLKTVGPILTIYTSYDESLRKEMPCGDRDKADPHHLRV